MKTIATAQIDGPEAKGEAQIVMLENGVLELRLIHFWVASGAPDVRIVFSKDPNGHIDNEMIQFIAKLPSGKFNENFKIDYLVDLNEMKTLVVYCKKFFAHFGHGTIY